MKTEKISYTYLCGSVSRMDFLQAAKNVENELNRCEDFVKREIKGNDFCAELFFLKGVTDRKYISESLIKPILDSSRMSDFCGEFDSLISVSSLKIITPENFLPDLAVTGNVLVLITNKNGSFGCLVNAQITVGRSITEASSDVTVKGPKGAFSEDAEKNMTALRQYIRTSKLKLEKYEVGEVSKTKVILCYIEGRAPNELVCELQKKLSSLIAVSVVDSQNVAMLLSGKSHWLIPALGSTEKIDKAASKLMSGRVAIIVDGSPFVLTAPYVFAEGIQSAEDYFHHPLYATFIRSLRLLCFLAAVFAPGILVALAEYLPQEFARIIHNARQDIPLSMFVEMLSVLILFEILREVGVRMPKTVGDAVGIVGSIILGDAAVQAGFVSSVSVITVALSAVSAFITPAFMYFIVLCRFGCLCLCRFLGVWGLALSVCFFISMLCCKSSFGMPYLFPLAPFDSAGMEDFVYADPKKTLGRKEIM